jgi:hypothetical protein
MLKGSRGVFGGWALNMTRRGVRVIVEREIGLGDVFEITVGHADSAPLVRQGRVVWFQQEADGFIAGIAFLDGSGCQRLDVEDDQRRPGEGPG